MNTKSQIKNLFLTILFLAGLFLLVISGVPVLSSGAAEAAVTSGSLAIGIRDDPVGLDPALIADSSSMFVTHHIYDTLARYAPGESTIVPGLAESWAVSADGLTWTFNIRSGIQFHDDTALDAAAVLYNFERWWDPAHPFHDGSFDYFNFLFGGFKDDPNCLISSLSTSGSQQFIIQLTGPFSPLPSVLAMPMFAIASPPAIQSSNLSTAPVGSGPFRFGEWVVGSHIRLDTNLDYWDALPELDELMVEVIPSDPERFIAVQNDTIQVAMDLPDQYVITATLDADLAVALRPATTLGYLGINSSHSPLDNPLVRQAIAHAINKPQLLADHYGPGYEPANQFLPPSIWGYNPAIPGFAYDPGLASSLLAQAGYTDGFTTTLAYRDVFRGYLPDPAAAAQAIHDDLLAVGINAVVVEYESGDFITKYRNGELDLFLLGWGADYLHPDNFLAPHFCDAGNLGFGSQDAVLCGLLDAARSEPDFDEQLDLYLSASARVMETLPVVPLTSYKPLLVRRANVTGMIPSAYGLDGYERTFLAEGWIYLPLTRR